MSATPPPSSKAYLLQNRYNSFFTGATLELTDTNLRCSVNEYSGWVEKALGIDDLKDRLSAGEPVYAFDFRRDRMTVKWLRQFLRGGFYVSEGDSRRWLVSLIYPSGVLSLLDSLDERPVHRQWRQALQSP